ncbi:MAG TPA: hypothetical protein VFM71_13795 [Gemmatimonadaceae bacterium]|nr:hypothetical protein [Gemmatimonadaceae bacterium]
MDFVAIDTGIAGDRITHAIAAQCKIRLPEAVGLLTLLFAGMAKHADDGNLAGILDSQLEEWTHWHGKRGTLAPILREMLCDDDGLVRAWDDWNGTMIAKAKRERDRLRKWRADRVRDADANSTRTRTRTVRDEETVPDLTVPNLTTTNNNLPATPKPPASRPKGKGDAAPRQTWITPFEAAWERHCGRGSFEIGPALKHLAHLRKHWPDDEILRRLDWYLENKGSEAVLDPRRLAERTFIPSVDHFRRRFAKFDPSGDSEAAV